MTIRKSNLSKSKRFFLAACAALYLLCFTFAGEQRAELRIALPVIAQGESKAASDEAKEDSPFPDGASLKSDPKLETGLVEADRCLVDGRVDLAVELWQQLLDGSAGVMITRDGWTKELREHTYRRYAPVTEQIEETLLRLSVPERRTYRLSADGQGRAILAAGHENRDQALAELVRRFFLSSLGDDASFELAQIELDRFNFVGAARLLQKIINEYPDPSVDRNEVLLRLAVANAGAGDWKGAKVALEELNKDKENVNSRMLARVTQFIEEAPARNRDATSVAGDWSMTLGGPSRNQTMLPPPKGTVDKTLTELWGDPYSISLSNQARNIRSPYQTRFIGGRGGMVVPAQQKAAAAKGNDAADEAWINRWKAGKWMPASEILLHNGLIYYKTDKFIVCRDAFTGARRWHGTENRYSMNIYSQLFGNGQRPTSQAEIFMFGDRIHQGMAIVDDKLVAVEGRPVDEKAPATAPQTSPYAYMQQATPQRAQNNYLICYGATSGDEVWRRTAHESGGETKYNVGFVGTPVSFGKSILIPVGDNGSLWVYAIDMETGKTLWKTSICDDPQEGFSPWSPVCISVEGSDAYVATGVGVVLAVDAGTGAIRWATRYQRSKGSTSPVMNMHGQHVSRHSYSGFERDMAIPFGKQLVVLASDFDSLFALDRRTGQFLWDTQRQPLGEPAVSYCLGVLGDDLYVAGTEVVRGYNLSRDGKMFLETKTDDMLGRGALTSDGIYVPIKDSVAKLDLRTGKKLAQVGVRTTTTEPVGNLYSDGKQLLVAGLHRVYALTSLESRLETLQARIEAGNGEAQIARMRLHFRAEKFDDALSDLRGAYEKTLKSQGAYAAQLTLVEALELLGLSARDPLLTLKLLTQGERDVEAGDVNETKREAISRRRQAIVLSCLKDLREQKPKESLVSLLAAGSLLADEAYVYSRRETIIAVAHATDLPLLKEKLSDKSSGMRALALSAISKLDGENSLEQMAGLLNDSDSSVQLAAAVAVSNVGDRRGLPVLGKLLDSEDFALRARSVTALRNLTGKMFEFTAYESKEQRLVASAEWRKWLETEGKTAKLKFPIQVGNYMLGRTILCYYNSRRVVEYDSTKISSSTTAKWTQTIPGMPWSCQGLPNGHRLIGIYNPGGIVEYDAEGKEVWKHSGLPGQTFSVERLRNGNTMVALYSTKKIIEISRDHKTVWEAALPGNPTHAQRLTNGNTLVTMQNSSKIIEIDRDGKEVWSLPGQSRPRAAQRLTNGNTLVCQAGNGTITEYDRDKKKVWEATGYSNPLSVQRLPNGNTLIADRTGVREIDRDKKEIWKMSGSNVSHAVRY